MEPEQRGFSDRLRRYAAAGYRRGWIRQRSLRALVADLELIVGDLGREVESLRTAVQVAGERPLDTNALLRTPLIFGDPARMSVHPTADLNNALINLSSGTVTVGEYAFFGHDVAVLTGTHDISVTGRARQLAVPLSGRDVVIESGAWIASRAVVQGPCRIGADAVVMPGAVVTHDVRSGTVVAGVPARELREL